MQEELEKSDGVAAAFVAGVPSAEWGQAVAAYVAVAAAPPQGDAQASPAGDPPSCLNRNGTGAGAPGPENRATAPELLMLPNGKPDRLAMTGRLNALHQGK